MKRVIEVKALKQDQSGATMIEYALIAAFIALALVAVLGELGVDLQSPFNDVSNTLAGEGGGGDPAPAEAGAL